MSISDKSLLIFLVCICRQVKKLSPNGLKVFHQSQFVLTTEKSRRNKRCWSLILVFFRGKKWDFCACSANYRRFIFLYRGWMDDIIISYHDGRLNEPGEKSYCCSITNRLHSPGRGVVTSQPTDRSTDEKEMIESEICYDSRRVSEREWVTGRIFYPSSQNEEEEEEAFTFSCLPSFMLWHEKNAVGRRYMSQALVQCA